MANTINRENTLLSAFLFADTIPNNTENTFKIDSNIFTSSFRRSLANKINDETSCDKYYGLLIETIEDHVMGTNNELEWMNILSANPMPLSVCSRIHIKLVSEYKSRVKDRL